MNTFSFFLVQLLLKAENREVTFNKSYLQFLFLCDQNRWNVFIIQDIPPFVGLFSLCIYLVVKLS